MSQVRQQSRSGGTRSPEFIFYALILGVQAFMAFNGGATSATIDSIEAGDGSWGPAGIGFLGAMDKLGMTLSSLLCGFLFQLWPAKTLLTAGLLINSCSCLIFGCLRNHSFMFAAKLLIGVTEGLQWVWAPQWINAWASVGHDPKHGANLDTRKQVWMNLNSSIIAGVGAGLGIVIAGLGTANGLSYEFAFKIEAGVLFFLWLVMLSVDKDLLTIHTAAYDHCSKVSPIESSDKLLAVMSIVQTKLPRRTTVWEQMRELWQNKLFCRCAIAFAMVNFTIAGMQFLWVRLYTGLWGVSKSSAVLSQLIIVAAGGGSGVAFSSSIRFTDSPAGKQRLAFTTKAFALALLGAIIATSGAIMQLYSITSSAFTLLTVYCGVFIVCAGLNMTPGLLQIICMENVDIDETRTLGTGVYQGLNNFFGLAMGPCIPQLVMSGVCHLYRLNGKDGLDPRGSLCAGFICALCGVCVSLSCSASAWCAASEEEVKIVVEDDV